MTFHIIFSFRTTEASWTIWTHQSLWKNLRKNMRVRVFPFHYQYFDFLLPYIVNLAGHSVLVTSLLLSLLQSSGWISTQGLEIWSNRLLKQQLLCIQKCIIANLGQCMGLMSCSIAIFSLNYWRYGSYTASIVAFSMLSSSWKMTAQSMTLLLVILLLSIFWICLCHWILLRQKMHPPSCSAQSAMMNSKT